MYNNGIVVTSTYNPLPCYYISALIYLALNIILGKGLNIFEGRLRTVSYTHLAVYKRQTF